MSAIETTPRKQTSLDWSFKRGAEDPETPEKVFAEFGPFQKLERKMSVEQFRGLKRKLECEREERAKQHKARWFCIEMLPDRDLKGLCLGVPPAGPLRNRYSENR